MVKAAFRNKVLYMILQVFAFVLDLVLKLSSAGQTEPEIFSKYVYSVFGRSEEYTLETMKLFLF